MKSKSKKLALSKESVRVLDKSSLTAAAGGTTISYHCDPFPSYDQCSNGGGCGGGGTGSGTDTRRCY